MSKVQLLDFQATASDQLNSIVVPKLDSALLISPTGTGKTYILGDLIKNLLETDQLRESKKPFPVIYVTKAPIVTQTQSVLYSEFGIDARKVFVTNYDSLRATLGKLFITWREQLNIETDSVEEIPHWNPEYAPEYIIADEAQSLRYKNTQQTKIMIQAARQGVRLIFSSATPFTRVSEAQTVTVALKPKVPGFGYINYSTWGDYSRSVSGNYDPTDFNNEAVKRLKDHLASKTVIVKGVKFKRRTFTSTLLVDFENADDRKRYLKAHEEYVKKMEKINLERGAKAQHIFAALMAYRKEAELIKAPYVAKQAFHVQTSKNKALILAANFKETIEIYKATLLKLGVPSERIAIIAGGQSKDQRQSNIKSFQSGKSDYCLLTLKSGGVGLSLHHNPSNEKTTKPRHVLLPFCYSAIEIVQVLGRGHRINSVSTTRQDILGFRGTIEEEVLEKLKPKLSCLSELVGKKETWVEAFSKQAVELESMNDLKEHLERETRDSDEDGLFEELPVEAYDNEPENELALITT